MGLLDNLVQQLPLVCQQRRRPAGEVCIGIVEQVLYKTFAAMQFEYVRYTCCVQSHVDSNHFSHSFSFNFSNFPAQWDAFYDRNRCYLHDPVVLAMLQDRNARLKCGTWEQAWDVAELQAMQAGETVKMQHYSDLQEASRRFGITSGVYMMINNGQRQIVVSLGTGRDSEAVAQQTDEVFYKTLFAIASVVDSALSLSSDCQQCKRLMRVGGGRSVELTQKQAHILKAFAEHPSASNGDIAGICHVTIETVAFHLKAVRRKFRMPNTSGHVLANVALLHGLI